MPAPLTLRPPLFVLDGGGSDSRRCMYTCCYDIYTGSFPLSEDIVLYFVLHLLGLSVDSRQ